MGMRSEAPGIKARVIKSESMDTSPPPGNSGGAVSGAAPCALAVEAWHSIVNVYTTNVRDPDLSFTSLLPRWDTSSNAHTSP